MSETTELRPQISIEDLENAAHNVVAAAALTHKKRLETGMDLSGKPKIQDLHAEIELLHYYARPSLIMGSAKYAPGNWMKQIDTPQEVINCIFRHWSAMCMGEWLDPESGLPHLSHIAIRTTFYTSFVYRAWRQKYADNYAVQRETESKEYLNMVSALGTFKLNGVDMGLAVEQNLAGCITPEVLISLSKCPRALLKTVKDAKVHEETIDVLLNNVIGLFTAEKKNILSGIGKHCDLRYDVVLDDMLLYVVLCMLQYWHSKRPEHANTQLDTISPHEFFVNGYTTDPSRFEFNDLFYRNNKSLSPEEMKMHAVAVDCMRKDVDDKLRAAETRKQRIETAPRTPVVMPVGSIAKIPGAALDKSE